MRDRCCFPNCENTIAGGTKLHSGRYLCTLHGDDWYFTGNEIQLQVAIVSALAAALPIIDACVFPTAALSEQLNRETRRLAAMNQRRIEYLKLAGFDRIDEGV